MMMMGLAPRIIIHPDYLSTSKPPHLSGKKGSRTGNYSRHTCSTRNDWMIRFPSVGKRKLCPDAKGGVGLRGVTADVAETACTAHTAHRLYTAQTPISCDNCARHKSRLQYMYGPWTRAELDRSWYAFEQLRHVPLSLQAVVGAFQTWAQQWKGQKPQPPSVGFLMLCIQTFF